MGKMRSMNHKSPCYYLISYRLRAHLNWGLGEDEREAFFAVVLSSLEYYQVEVLSLCVSCDGYQMLVYSNNKPIPPTKAAAIYNKRTATKCKLLKPRIDKVKCVSIGQKLVSIDSFLGSFSGRISRIIRKNHPPEKEIWQRRYDSVEIAPEQLETAMAFVELDCVRSNQTEDPVNYHASSIGRYRQTGQHPFAESAATHLKSIAGPDHQQMSTQDVLDAFCRHLQGYIIYEQFCSNNPKFL